MGKRWVVNVFGPDDAGYSFGMSEAKGMVQDDAIRELVSACRLVVHGTVEEAMDGLQRIKRVVGCFDELEV